MVESVVVASTFTFCMVSPINPPAMAHVCIRKFTGYHPDLPRFAFEIG